MKSLFEEDSYQHVKKRINTLSQQHQPQWGKMSVGQMVTHCQYPLKVALDDKPRKRILNPLPLLFKTSMYNDKPWRKNLPTIKVAKITDQRDLDQERSKLLALIDGFYEKRTQTEWQVHPFFGKLTPEQWGKMQYKHLDHHLTQFGV
ncbi:MAG: hypothetical protein CL867_08010 [Cytophagaceae bacterium]|nr:hypothetical protein [Cytophagaceae bacterium]